MADENTVDLTPAEQAALAQPDEFVEVDDEAEGDDDEAGADDAGDEDADESAEDDADPAPMAAIPDWQPPADAEQQLASINFEAEQAAALFDAGRLSAAEFHNSLANVNAQRAELTKQIDRAEIGRDLRVANWVNGTVESFLQKHPRYKGNETLFAALDAEVRRLQAESGDPFDAKHLQTAHRNLQAAAAAVRTSRKSGRRVSSDVEEMSSGAHLDQLDQLADIDPHAFEEAYLKLSDAEREQFLERP